MDSPFTRRLAKARIGDAGRKSEKRVAKDLGARLRPASGAMTGAKGDFQKAEYLGESKSTKNKTLPLEHDWLIKIAHEAACHGKVPVLTISFVDEQGRPRTQRNAEWVCLPMWHYQELIDRGE